MSHSVPTSTCIFISVFSVLTKEFCLIFHSEETTLSFLKQKRHIENDDYLPYCMICGYENRIHAQKGKSVGKLNVTDEKVVKKRSHSVKVTHFFTSKDKNCKCNSGLSLSQILILVYYCCLDIPQNIIGSGN